jgi:hypothetical protein
LLPQLAQELVNPSLKVGGIERLQLSLYSCLSLLAEDA